MRGLRSFKARFRIRKAINRISYYLGLQTVAYPHIVYLVVNSRCNLRCSMCDVGRRDAGSNLYKNLDRGDMDLARLKQAVDQFAGRSVVMTLNSTEPLLYPHLFAALSYIGRTRGMVSKIATNGFLLPSMAEGLVLSRLTILTVSLDGPERIHDMIRGVKHSYRNARFGIQEVGRYAKLHRQPVMVRINSTINIHNCSVLSEFLSGLNGLGIDTVNLNHLNFITDEMIARHNADKSNPETFHKAGFSPGDIDTKVLYHELLKIRRAVKAGAYDFQVTENPRMDRAQLERYYHTSDPVPGISNTCYFPWSRVQILQDGEVLPIMRCYSFSFGNIFSQPFASIWNGKDIKRFRRRLNKERFLPACVRCCGVFSQAGLMNDLRLQLAGMKRR